MNPEDDSIDSSADAQAWLDGLAGRTPASTEGGKLRSALHPGDEIGKSGAMPAWKEIVGRAQNVEASNSPPRASAANHASWRRPAFGAVVVLLLSTAVLFLSSTLRDRDDGSLRGSPAKEGAVWRTGDPVSAARELATRLVAAGARVSIVEGPEGLALEIESDAGTVAAVDAVLAPIDAAVDSTGRLRLRVLAPR